MELALLAWEVSIRLAVLGDPPEDRSVLAETSLSTWGASLELHEVSVELRVLASDLDWSPWVGCSGFDLVNRVLIHRTRGTEGVESRAEVEALGEALRRAWSAGVFGAGRRVAAGEPSDPWLVRSVDSSDGFLLYVGSSGTGAIFADLPAGATVTGPALERRAPGLSDRVADRLGLVSGAGGPVARLGVFRLLGPLGEGGMGLVQLAEQSRTGRYYAVKVARTDNQSIQADLRARFEREIMILGRCEHDGVAGVVDSGLHEGAPWYAMRFVDGPTLELLARPIDPDSDLPSAVRCAHRTQLARWPAATQIDRGRVPDPPNGRVPPWPDLALLLADVADALHHLHVQGVVHRDVSAANVIIAWPSLRPVLTDFGLAAFDAGPWTAARPVSRREGTPRYCAPEMLGDEPALGDARSDLYAVAAVGFELVAGRPVRADQSDLSRPDCLEAPWAHLVRAAVPAELSAILHRALSVYPGGRYASAAELAADLRRFADGRRVAAPLKTRAQAVRSSLRRWRLLLAAAGLALVAAAGSLAVGERHGRIGAKATIYDELQPVLLRLKADEGSESPELLREIEHLVERLRPSHVPEPLPSSEKLREAGPGTTRGGGTNLEPNAALADLVARAELARELGSDGLVAWLGDAQRLEPEQLDRLAQDVDRVGELAASIEGPGEVERIAAAEEAWRAAAEATGRAWVRAQLLERSAWAAERRGDLGTARADLEMARKSLDGISVLARDSQRPVFALARLARLAGDPVPLERARKLVAAIERSLSFRLDDATSQVVASRVELARLDLAVEGDAPDSQTLSRGITLLQSVASLSRPSDSWRLDFALELAEAAWRTGDDSAAAEVLATAVALPEAEAYLSPEVFDAWRAIAAGSV